MNKLSCTFFICLICFVSGSNAFADHWWNRPGSQTQIDAQYLKMRKNRNENSDAFAEALKESLKTGKGMGYLDQGGVSPSWYKTPITTEPFPGTYQKNIYDLAYSAFLQSHQLQNAYRLAWSAVQKVPDEKIWRKRLIQVGTWLGQREEVMKQWHWLATHGDPSAVKNTITLASSLSRPDIIVEMLSPQAKLGKLSQDNWKTLIYAYGELGQPEKAVADIDASLRIHKSRFLLEQKAYLTYQMGKIKNSLDALRQVTRLYGAEPEIALKEAQLQSMSGNYSNALEVMQLAKSKASASDVPFWHLYAILAWEQNDRSAALESEKRLYLLGAADEYDYQRLIMLTQDTLPKAALAVAMAGWHKFKLPIFFFESIALAANQQDWHELQQLLARIPESDPMGLKQYPAYWIALAQWEVSNHRPQTALNAYAQGLELSPGDPVIQEDILWLLVDEHDEKNLRAILVGDLGGIPNLKAALISAMQILHRPNLAMYLQSQQRIPADDQALLNRADILNNNGLDGLAWAQRTIVAQDIAQEMQRKNKIKEKTS